MTQACAINGRKANFGTEHLFSGSRTSVQSTKAVMKKAHALWPAKTSEQVAAITNVSPRAAYHWKAGKREMSADAIAQLLQSEDGIHFLVALMDKARPAWWSALLRMGVLGGIHKRRAADLRLLQRLADADQSQHAIPSAALFPDAEFYQPLADAAQSLAGTEDRPVASARPLIKRR